MSIVEAHVAVLTERMDSTIKRIGEVREEGRACGTEVSLVKIQFSEIIQSLSSTQSELAFLKSELITAKNEIIVLKDLVTRYRGGWAAIAGLGAICGGTLAIIGTSITILKFWHPA